MDSKMIGEAISTIMQHADKSEFVGQTADVMQEHEGAVRALVAINAQLVDGRRELEQERAALIKLGRETPVDPANPDGENVLDGKNEGKRKEALEVWLGQPGTGYQAKLDAIAKAEQDKLYHEAEIQVERFNMRGLEVIASLLG